MDELGFEDEKPNKRDNAADHCYAHAFKHRLPWYILPRKVGKNTLHEICSQCQAILKTWRVK